MQLPLCCQLNSQLLGCATTTVRQLPPVTMAHPLHLHPPQHPAQEKSNCCVWTPARWYSGHRGYCHQHREGGAWLPQPSSALSPAIPSQIVLPPPLGVQVQLGGSSYLVTMPLGDWGALHWKEAFLEVTVRISGGGCSEGGAGCVVIWAMGPLLQQLKQVQASTPMEYVVKGFSPCIVCWVAVPSESYKN